MPELWLNYGAAEVVLDIKVENLNAYDNPRFCKLEDPDLEQVLGSVPLEEARLFALDGSRSVAKVISCFARFTRERGMPNLPVDCLQKDYSGLSKSIDDVALSITKQAPSNIVEKGLNPKTIFISSSRQDPLFGFEGGPTIILRKFLKDKMTKAYNARTSNIPCPGIRTSPLQIALESCQDMTANCVHIISSNDSIESIFFGQITESFEKSINRLQSLACDDYLNIRSMIISADKNSDSHLSLSDSLKYLWNCVHVLKNNGFGILISENKNGLGSDALRRFLEGRLTVDDCYTGTEYIEGIEHLLFINELKEKYQLGILSSLPHYYLNSKFGLHPYSRTHDIITKILEINGKSHKVLVISDPNRAVFRCPTPNMLQ
jgi:hypothetical protein